jgi:ABC-type transporter Mla subunit MlaD
MTRRPSTSIVASPVLIGAITVLVVIVGVVLAYNANRGLPFVPSLQVKVRADNAAALGKGAEVREGGTRVGFVERVKPVKGAEGTAVAELQVKLDSSVGDVPVDTTFTIRPRSPLGLKYLEMVRGGSQTAARQGHVFPPEQTGIPVQIDDFNRIYDRPTRAGVQRNLRGFGDTFAGRGASLNEAIGELPRLFFLLEPVSANLADPGTRLGRFFRELGDAARVVSPIAAVQSELFTRSALTFEAFSREPESLKETISRSHPTFQAGIESFPVQRPFLVDSARLARAMRPVARDLRPTLPQINAALARGIPVQRRAGPFYREDLKPTLAETRELFLDPGTGIAFRGLRANATTLQPTLRYLGPFQTVCNYWTYFWTNLAEHLSQENQFGFIQRTQVKSTGQQNNSPASMASWAPANGEGYVEASRPRGSPVHLHGTSYNAAIDEQGRADCENGQRGYVTRLASFSPPSFNIGTDPHFPGNQGPTYTGRSRVPRGQSFTREPLTGAQHE